MPITLAAEEYSGPRSDHAHRCHHLQRIKQYVDEQTDAGSLMRLPPYRLPSIRSIARSAVNGGIQYKYRPRCRSRMIEIPACATRAAAASLGIGTSIRHRNECGLWPAPRRVAGSTRRGTDSSVTHLERRQHQRPCTLRTYNPVSIAYENDSRCPPPDGHWPLSIGWRPRRRQYLHSNESNNKSFSQ